ncbi:cysteine hydrolase family protein [Aeromonas sp. S9(2024)]|uniref:cysteine hydrolase family protein n=1 Tax=Aeromonas sp. S9(2024) TaxID=3242882 RepID=UPI0035282C47
MDVLLIIDVQQGLFTEPRYRQEQVLANINRAAAYIRQHHGRIIYVQHDGPPGSELVPGTPGWQLHPALQPAKGDSRVRKEGCDSFLDTELAFLLAEQPVDRLILCGCATDFCVDTTVRSAASHGFEVLVLSDGHTTADRPHLGAAQIIEHHNWMWHHLSLPQGRGVTLLSTDELLAVTPAVQPC